MCQKPLRLLTKKFAFLLKFANKTTDALAHTHTYTHSEYACMRVLAKIEFVPDFDIIFIKSEPSKAQAEPHIQFPISLRLIR